MTNAYEREIKPLKKIVISSIQCADSYSVIVGSDRLSLLYLEEMKSYSRTFDLEESKEKKEKIRQNLSSIMEDWRWMIELRNDFERSR